MVNLLETRRSARVGANERSATHEKSEPNATHDAELGRGTMTKQNS